MYREELPAKKNINPNISHAPNRKDILNKKEKQLAIRNALRYFTKHMHATLAPEFLNELKTYGRIYMYRFMPNYEIKARHIEDFPHKSKQAASIRCNFSSLKINFLTNSRDSLIIPLPSQSFAIQ